MLRHAHRADGLTASIYVLLPVLAQAFGLGYAQVGVIRAAHSAAMWVLELPSGIISERFGQRHLLAFGLLASGVGYLSVSAAAGFTRCSSACASPAAGLRSSTRSAHRW